MNQLLSIQDMERIFALYWGQELLMPGPGAKRLVEINYYRMQHISEDYHLGLTPLAKITDEHAIIIADVLGVNASSDEYKIKKIKDWITMGCYEANNFKGMEIGIWRSYNVFRELALLGYDFPQYFGKDHPCNGYTAIELGIAIDATLVTFQK